MSLTKDDFQQLGALINEAFESRGREIIKQEVEHSFESRGREIVREEVETLFETRGREIVREEVENLFNIRGRAIVREEVSEAIRPLEGQVEALNNDVKEIYSMI